MIFIELSVPFLPNGFDCDEEFKPLELDLSWKYGTLIQFKIHKNEITKPFIEKLTFKTILNCDK